MTPEQVNVCPVCGSENLEYAGYDVEDQSIAYNWDCDDCESSGVEYHDFVFAFHSVTHNTKETESCPK